MNKTALFIYLTVASVADEASTLQPGKWNLRFQTAFLLVIAGTSLFMPFSFKNEDGIFDIYRVGGVSEPVAVSDLGGKFSSVIFY